MELAQAVAVLQPLLLGKTPVNIQPYDYSGFYVECSDGTQFALILLQGERWHITTSIDVDRIGLA